MKKEALKWPQAGPEPELDVIAPNQQLQYFAPHHWPSCFICFYFCYVGIFLKGQIFMWNDQCFQFDFLRNSCQSISPRDAALTFSSLLIKARNHEWQYCQSYFSEIPERILCPWQYPWVRCYICRGEEISHGPRRRRVQFVCLVCKSATWNITSS